MSRKRITVYIRTTSNKCSVARCIEVSLMLTFSIAYRGEYKSRLKFLCLPEFQSHNTLRANYIQLQRKNYNFHGLTIKTKMILGLKLGQIQVHIIMTFALRSAIEISSIAVQTQ